MRVKLALSKEGRERRERREKNPTKFKHLSSGRTKENFQSEMVGDHSLPPCCTLHLDYCNNVIEIFLKGKMSFLSNLRWKPKKYKWYIF